jgi:phenylpropionate dioxygenase-like ring-hydroxylating dioxygenase large terminal subunit
MMAPHEKEVGPYRFADMKPLGARSNTMLDVNWKCVVENDSEGYHVDIGHPGLRRLFGNSYYDQPFENGVARSWSVLRDELSSVWSERLYQELLPSVDHLPESHRRAWWYLGLFPTPSFVIMPDHVQYYQVIPMGLHKTRIHGISLGLEDGRREMRAARYLSGRINLQVAREDLGFCAWTDEGLRSRSYLGGPLSEREVALRSFVDQIREVLPVARMSEPPAGGRLTGVEEEFQASA